MAPKRCHCQAQKRRLFVLPQLVADLKARIATEKGEVTADVTAPVALTPAQAEALEPVVASYLELQGRADPLLAMRQRYTRG